MNINLICVGMDLGELGKKISMEPKGYFYMTNVSVFLYMCRLGLILTDQNLVGAAKSYLTLLETFEVVTLFFEIINGNYISFYGMNRNRNIRKN